MPDYPADAFTLYGNFNKDKKTDGAYWASIEVPVDELRKLFAWVKDADKVENQQGNKCVKLRGALRPCMDLRIQIYLHHDIFTSCVHVYTHNTYT